MATNYGADIFWPGDVPLISTITTDPFRVVGQRIVNRLSTPRGGLAVIGGDPNFGWDVRRYVLARASAGKLSQAQQQVQAEVLKDEAVRSAIVIFTYNGNGTLTIQVDCVLAVGPLSLVLTVTALTVSAVYNYGGT
jgi:hypothetical protein